MRINERHTEFTGTSFYFKVSLMNQNILGTEGVLFIAEKYGAFWLLDAIASHLSPLKDNDFVVILLDHAPTNNYDSRFILSIQDDIPMNKQYAKQTILSSDFPEDGVQFYAQKNEDKWVIYLPSEH